MSLVSCIFHKFEVVVMKFL